MKTEMICAGFGGQGALTIGKFLVKAGMNEGKNVSWLPSYGPEMRGGTANVSTVISDKPVGSPVVAHPDIVVALNQPSIDKFGPMIKPDGLLIFNEDMCPDGIDRTDINIISAPMTSIAKEIGNLKVMNMVAIGVVMGKTGLVQKETMLKAIAPLKAKAPELYDMNLAAIDKGFEIGKTK
ncbi:MAG: 2-oxoacid:acceptor oxidoreductase family protein [Candidatus Stygibacter australis]|nr:2-oxoacid:acceptor oxidoreductase family protein [Candidatus Stygibacter australis]MDP8322507.1 2-oxoacid:acceptor oxidoreductase family protein [Candidatus Stygibacter australis]